MKKKTLLIDGAILVVVGVVIAGYLSYSNHQIIPKPIAKQVSFAVFWPNSANAVPDPKTIKYDAPKGVLSYLVTVSGSNTTVTEQATPSEFADISNAYSTLISRLHNYDTFGSTHGTVYLTKPDNTSGQTGVINQSGTLLFAHSQSNITQNNWRLFFNNLRVVQN